MKCCKNTILNSALLLLYTVCIFIHILCIHTHTHEKRINHIVSLLEIAYLYDDEDIEHY